MLCSYFRKNPQQSEDLYHEQRREVNVTDSYVNVFGEKVGTFIKCWCVYGAPGSGKSFIRSMI